MVAPVYTPSILVRGVDITTPMTNYTPTITPQTGAFVDPPVVSIAASTKIGDLVIFTFQFVLGANIGTAAGVLSMTLPSTSAYPVTALLEEYATVGRIDRGNISASGTVLNIRQLAGTTSIASGAGFRGTGFYLES